MTLDDAIKSEDPDALEAAVDAALAVILRESAYAWSVHAVLDVLLAAGVLAAGLGRPSAQLSEAATANLIGMARRVTNVERVEAARAAITLLRASPRLEEIELMQGSDPEWSEIYAEALSALDSGTLDGGQR